MREFSYLCMTVCPCMIDIYPLCLISLQRLSTLEKINFSRYIFDLVFINPVLVRRPMADSCQMFVSDTYFSIVLDTGSGRFGFGRRLAVQI